METKEYYYIDEAGKQFGPYTLEMFRLLPLSRRTYVWRSDLADWIRAEALPELDVTLREQEAKEAKAKASESQADLQPVPSQPVTASTGAPMPKSWLVESVLATLFCSLIGLVSFFHAMQVRARYEAGDYAGALRESMTARRWLIITLVVGLVLNLIYYFVFRDQIAAMLP